MKQRMIKKFHAAALIVFFALLAANPVAGADLFVRKDKERPTAIKPIFPPPAPTETKSETIEDFSKRYRENCLRKQHPFLKGESLQMLCDCSAGKLEKSMTVDDVKAMMEDTPTGQTQRNRMAVYVYAPCMGYPVRAMLLHNCSVNEQVLAEHKNADKICTCMADDIAAYIAANAQSVLFQRLAANPDDPDPLGSFMADEGFKGKTQESFLACVRKTPPFP